jgi:hypothetical protein
VGFFGLFKSNFTRIAENTTKFYLELKNNYSDRFPDETSLLAAAGILDAQTYVFHEKSIQVETVLHIAGLAVSPEQAPSELSPYRSLATEEILGEFHTKRQEGDFGDAFLKYSRRKDDLLKKEPLFDFVFSLEVEILKVDCPRITPSEIALACYQKRNTITKAIQDVKGKYRSQIAQDAACFMELPRYQPIRKQLGVRD